MTRADAETHNKLCFNTFGLVKRERIEKVKSGGTRDATLKSLTAHENASLLKSLSFEMSGIPTCRRSPCVFSAKTFDIYFVLAAGAKVIAAVIYNRMIKPGSAGLVFISCLRGLFSNILPQQAHTVFIRPRGNVVYEMKPVE